MRRTLVVLPALLLGLLPSCKREAPPPAATATSPAPSAPAPSASAAVPEKIETAGIHRLEAKLAVGDELGTAVGLAGERIAVTAYKRGSGAEDAKPGSVLVFKQKGSGYELETELTADKSYQIGNALAFDGTMLLAGAMFDTGAAPETGAAYVATHGDAGWSKLTKLRATGGKADDSFGISVALAGQTLIVGNTREKGGSLYTFEATKTGFAPKQTLPFVEGNGPGETLSAFGDVIAVGAEFSGKLSEQGSVRLYTRGAKGFQAGQVLEESSPAETQHFGNGVAVGKSGIAVASEKQISIFELTEGKYKETAHFVPPLSGLQYARLALGDGVLVLGFPLEDEGRVLVYKKQPDGWKLERTLRAPDGKKDDWFGAAIAFDTKHLVVGAPLKDERTGAAYVIDL